jgi:tRNA(Ile2) C34 agmatinyltransferase TiaS
MTAMMPVRDGQMGFVDYSCAKCNQDLSTKGRKRPNFCSNCGTEVDWDAMDKCELAISKAWYESQAELYKQVKAQEQAKDEKARRDRIEKENSMCFKILKAIKKHVTF